MNQTKRGCPFPSSISYNLSLENIDMSAIYIDKEFVIGHLEDVDLSNLPVVRHESGAVKPVLIGYINRYRSYDNYAFGITNNYGIDSAAIPSAPVQVYIDKSEWVDKEDIKENIHKLL